MKSWLRRLRGAIGMGVTWAAAWAVFGLLIGVTSVLLPGLPWWDRFFDVFDAPLPALAVPGFIGGAIFSIVLGVAGRRRRFDELSLPRFAAWGAVGGMLLGLLPAAMVAVGLASTEGSDATVWQTTAAIVGPLTILCAASAAGTLWLARRAQRRERFAAGSAGYEPLDGDAARELRPGDGAFAPADATRARARPEGRSNGPTDSPYTSEPSTLSGESVSQ